MKKRETKENCRCIYIASQLKKRFWTHHLQQVTQGVSGSSWGTNLSSQHTTLASLISIQQRHFSLNASLANSSESSCTNTAVPLDSILCYRLVRILCTALWSSHTCIVMWLVSPSQQQSLMSLPARDSSISSALPLKLLVPVLQCFMMGRSHSVAQSGLLSASAQGLSDEFSCCFNYAAIHSATQSLSMSTVYS